jgi:hypothetical protein
VFGLVKRKKLVFFVALFICLNSLNVDADENCPAVLPDPIILGVPEQIKRKRRR